MAESFSGTEMPRPEPTETESPRLENFHELTIEEKVANATLIALARFETENDRHRAMLTEVLKRDDNVAFYYEVGKEYPHASRWKNPDVSLSEGPVIFFVGSPAEFRYSSNLEHDRLLGAGDMPLSELRRLIAESAEALSGREARSPG